MRFFGLFYNKKIVNIVWSLRLCIDFFFDRLKQARFIKLYQYKVITVASMAIN